MIPTPPADQIKANSEFFAVRLVNTASSEVSASIDTFSSWVAVGSGAAIGLLFANLEQLDKFIPTGTVGRASILLAWVLAVAVVQKAVASVAAPSLRSFERGWSQGASAAQEGLTLEFSYVFALMARAYPQPLRWLSARAKKSSDLAAHPRAMIRLVLLQMALVVAEIVLVICAVYSVASRLVA